MLRRSLAMLAVGVLVAAADASADVARVEVKARRDVQGGRTFGAAGAYEAVTGTVHVIVDPANPHDRIIPDLDRAPKDANGRVHAAADFYLLAPKDRARGNHVLLLDIANRGNRIALRSLDRAERGARGDADSEVGDGFLLAQGYAVLWVGWQADLPSNDRTLRADLPRALGVDGMMRGDFTLARDAGEAPIPGAEYNPPLDRDGAQDVLLVRGDPYSAAVQVPRGRWRFSEDRKRLIADDGLKAGNVYDVIYRTKDPFVAGLGFAAVRDAAAAARAGRFAELNVTKTIAFGESQSGRMLRDFLYQGFNADEKGRRVFDGFMIHIAGGARGSFTQRFAASGGDTYFYPVRFPFTLTEEQDPATAERDGLLSRAIADRVVPKLILTNSAVEYWGGRAASLTHTTLDGTRDVPLPDNARLYFLAGQQHSPAAFPPKRGGQEGPQQLPNPLDATWTLRRLLVSMTEWVGGGAAPPASRHPTIADRTLLPVGALKFPGAIGNAPTQLPMAVRLDMGSQFKRTGVAALPAAFGAPYTLLVPAVDADGNEIAGVRMPEQAVPLATYTGWNFRDAAIGSPQSFVRLVGSYVPFPLTRQARTASGDTRLSIEERYKDRADYLGRITAAAQKLVADGFLLAGDVDAIAAHAAEHWAWRQAAASPTAGPR